VANVLLGVTGSVAAIRTPALFEALRQARHAVKVVATQASLYFFDPAALDPRDGRRNPASLVLDEDEWPGREEGRRWQREDPVLHIELRRWADVLVVAPLDANTLAKFAGGLADNCLTCVWRAWDPARPIVLAPAMNTFMWDHPLTARHLRQLATDRGIDALGSVEDAVARVNGVSCGLRIVGPQSKRLACGDVGLGAMAEVGEVIEAVAHVLC
jgi:phosphopantothenoylcysteine decarboxylase